MINGRDLIVTTSMANLWRHIDKCKTKSYKLNRANLLLISLQFLALLYCKTIRTAGANLAESCQDFGTLLFKVDCHPDANSNEADCLSRGCCWQESSIEPSCFFASEHNCYSVNLIEEGVDYKSSLRQNEQKQKDPASDWENNFGENEKESTKASLHSEELAHDEASIVQNDVDDDDDDDHAFGRASSKRFLLSRKANCQPSGFTNDASKLVVEVKIYGESLISVKISEADKQRFTPELPEIELPTSNKYIKRKKKNDDNNNKTNNNSNSKSFKNNNNNNSSDEQTQWLAVGKHIRVLFSQKRRTGNSHISNSKRNDPSLVERSIETSESENGGVLVDSHGLVLKVIHSRSDVVLFETDLGKLIYSEQFIQLPLELPSSYVYGLGQHMSNSLLKRQPQQQQQQKQHSDLPPKTYTMFNYAHPPKADGRHSYSSYPFFVNLANLQSNERRSNSSNDVTITTYVDGHEESERKERIIIMKNNGSTKDDFEMSRKVLATGALMLNSNAMDVVLLQPTSKSERGAALWRLTGGIVELYLFLGPTPHDVVGQYQNLVGKPALPPSWALGYHQSRMNYRDLMPIKMAWARSRSAAIPMESFWTDIEFLWRTTSYSVGVPELNDFVVGLQEKYQMHYVTVVDPAIDVEEEEDDYLALKLAKQMNLFATTATTRQNNTVNDLTHKQSKHNHTNSLNQSPIHPPSPDTIEQTNNRQEEEEPALVTTWTDSGSSALIDFTNPHAVDYLKQVLAEYKKNLHFNGLWLDMNEPEVFANNNNNNDNMQQDSCPYDEQLKYEPGQRRLNDRTLCMSAKFYAGLHRDIHNLYAFYQSKAHFEALRSLDPNHRPFIISRAQFVGQGKYSGTWLGDMGSTFDHLRWSLIGTIESNWFGQPLVGADICGFFGHTTDELCARWFSLGAFYPFARNHNDGSSRDQDPGSLSEIVQDSARVALMRRYSLLPYLYTLFFDNHLKGQPVIRSALFEFFEQYQTDTDNLDDLPQINDQMMLGPAIMIAPLLEEGKDRRTVHLAQGLWYDISIGLPGTLTEEGHFEAARSNWPLEDKNQTFYLTNQLEEFAKRKILNLHKTIECKEQLGCLLPQEYTPLGSINMYLRGGRIVPTFYKVSHSLSIAKLWEEPVFFLEVGLDEFQSSYGSMYWDDGESDPGSHQYNQVDFWTSNNRLVISLIEENIDKIVIRVGGFSVYGLKSIEQPEVLESDRIYQDVILKYSYDSEKQILKCLFKTLQGDELKPLALRRFESLKFRW